jgi:hypothetical protein
MHKIGVFILSIFDSVNDDVMDKWDEDRLCENEEKYCYKYLLYSVGELLC